MRFLASLGMTGLSHHDTLDAATLFGCDMQHEQSGAELRQIDLIFGSFEYFLTESIHHDDVFQTVGINIHNTICRIRVNADVAVDFGDAVGGDVDVVMEAAYCHCRT